MLTLPRVNEEPDAFRAFISQVRIEMSALTRHTKSLRPLSTTKGGDDMNNRPTNNRFETDFLPPFGVPEVSYTGEWAKFFGFAVALVAVGKYIEA